MTTRSDLVDRLSAVLDQIDVLKIEKEFLEEQLRATGIKVGETLTSKNGNTLRACDRGVIQPDKLEAAVSPTVWRSVTKRVPVAALLAAAVERKKLDPKVLATCYKRSKMWFERR